MSLESILFLNTLCLLSADKHAIRFIPRENGVHSIDVRFNGSHIPGSPFKIRVGEPGQVGDPGMVSAFGPGLEGGTTGNRPHSLINKHTQHTFNLISNVSGAVCQNTVHCKSLRTPRKTINKEYKGYVILEQVIQCLASQM